MLLKKREDVLLCAHGAYTEFNRISEDSRKVYNKLLQFYRLYIKEMEKILIRENCKPNIVKAPEGFFFLSGGNYYYPDYLVFIPTRLRSLEEDFLVIVPISLSLNGGQHKLEPTALYKELTLETLKSIVKAQIGKNKGLNIESLINRVIMEMESHNISLSSDVEKLSNRNDTCFIEDIINANII